MEKLVRMIFEQRTAEFYPEQGKKLQEMHNRRAANGTFNNGIRVQDEVDIRLTTVNKCLDALVESYREALAETKTPMTEETATEAKKDIDEMLKGKFSLMDGEIK